MIHSRTGLRPIGPEHCLGRLDLDPITAIGRLTGIASREATFFMNTQTVLGFDALGISAGLTNRLKTRGIVEPTPIQAGAIPVALDGHDLIGLAQTGTGKTLAFGLPLMETLRGREVALVLAPTRELAHQIQDTFRGLGATAVLVVGGESMYRQVKELKYPHDIVVATPGRLMDHLEQRTYKLDRIKAVVLDEADRMLDMGFSKAIEKILSLCPAERQTMLFSATMPPEIEKLATKFLRNPERVEVEGLGSPNELVDQELVYLPHEEKGPALSRLLKEEEGTVLVFSRTRHGARKLAKSIRGQGHEAAEIHSDRTLAQRREALRGFKTGRYRVLVATDIAARGIDVKEISLVVNYDVPENPEDYVHRIGRTGRAGARGRAVTLAIPAQRPMVRAIEKVLGDRIELGANSLPVAIEQPRGNRGEAPRPGKARFWKGGKREPGQGGSGNRRRKKFAKAPR